MAGRLGKLAAHLVPTPPADIAGAAGANPTAAADAPVRVLVLGGLGAVGSGLRTYMPLVSSLAYEFTSVDLCAPSPLPLAVSQTRPAPVPTA